MNKNYRYYNLLKQSKFGLCLPRGSIYNFLKIKTDNINGKMGFGYPSPPMISVLAAKRCNLSCSFCICAGFPDDWRDYELTPEKFQKILNLDIAKKSIIVCFTGGEPLLNKDLDELICMAVNNKHLTGMISNGLLLEERAKDLSKAGLCDLQVSIYENTKQKLGNILANTSSYFPINISYVLLKSILIESEKNNFSSIIDIIKMCIDSGCASFKLNLCEPAYGKNDFSETIDDTDEVYISFIEKCKQELRNVNFSGYMCKPTLLTRKFSVFFPQPTSKNHTMRYCRTSWRTALVDANGNYGICCRMPPRSGEYGNLLTHGEEIINSEKAINVRRPLLDTSLNLAPECRNCVHLSGSYGSKL